MSIRTWTKDDLTIAYYIAKWNVNGLGVTQEEIANFVLENTTIGSLKMQVSNFRYIMEIPGPQLKDASIAMYELVDELYNSTYTNTKKIVLKLIQESGARIEKGRIARNNKGIADRAKKMNEKSKQAHAKRIMGMRKKPS